MATKKIVVSDDRELLALLRNSFFEREGFTLVPVRDGQTGCQAIEAEAPTLAILDLARLGEQALACCRMVKTDPLLNMTPLMLILPDQASAAQLDECWASGCDAVVERPLTVGRVLDAACGLLGISRRLARRFPVCFHLEYLGTDQKLHAGTAVNLNAGGMFLASEQLFPVDTQLVLDFTLPGLQAALRCPVRVAWVNHPEWRKKNALPCGMGVEFQNLASTPRAAIQEFLASLSVKD